MIGLFANSLAGSTVSEFWVCLYCMEVFPHIQEERFRILEAQSPTSAHQAILEGSPILQSQLFWEPEDAIVKRQLKLGPFPRYMLSTRSAHLGCYPMSLKCIVCRHSSYRYGYIEYSLPLICTLFMNIRTWNLFFFIGIVYNKLLNFISVIHLQ